MEHSFDIDLAEEIGIEEAIIFKHICYWVQKNEANEMNFFDGTTWTFNSVKGFNEIFYYMTPKKIRNVLTRLEELGLIKTGNFNKAQFDRTKWYAITEKGKCIYPKRQIHLPVGANASAQKGKPIPDINTYINTDINKKTFSSSGDDVSEPAAFKRTEAKPGRGEGDSILLESDKRTEERIPTRQQEEARKKALATQKEANEAFERLWKKYPNKRGKGSVSEKKKRDILAVGEDQMERCIERYIEEHERLREEGRFCPEWKQGSTFFNSGYIDYLDENFCQEEAICPVLEEMEEPETINLWECDDETFERLMREKNGL